MKEDKVFVTFADGKKLVGLGDWVFPVTQNGHGWKRLVTAIGRKYITVGDGKGAEQYDMETGQLKTNGTSSTLWSSEADYREKQLIEKYNTTLKSLVLSTPRNSFTIAQVYAACKMLGIEDKLEEAINKGKPRG